MESDERLFERLRGGELDAFDALYARHARRLHGFVRAHLHDSAEAEDVLHESFMTLLEGRTPDFAHGSVRAWLYQVARNASLNRLRSRVRGQHAVAVAAQAAPPAASDAEQSLAKHQAVVALNQAVERLPGALSEVYALRAAGLSYDEMAQVLAVPLGTVKSRMHELVGRLREEMIPWTAP